MPSKPKLFRPRPAKSTVEMRRDYDRSRGTARERGYTAGWDAAAITFKFAHPLCLGCQAVGRVTATTVVDHVIPHKGDRLLLWDRTNWQSACDPHHNVVKQVLERMYAAGECEAADLRLDSPIARRLTRELLPALC